MYRSTTGPRAEYREQQGQRVRDSGSLADKFPELKSLTVELTYYEPEGVVQSSQIKYTVNLTNAKSLFRFDCQNDQCVRGDFDLSDGSAAAAMIAPVPPSSEKFDLVEALRTLATLADRLRQSEQHDLPKEGKL